MKRIDKYEKRDIKDISFEDLLRLSSVDAQIHEILRQMEFIPDDLKKFEKEIEKIKGDESHLIQSISVLDKKIEECERYLALENDRLEKAAKLTKLSKDQKTYNAAKRFSETAQRLYNQMHEVMAKHLEKKEELSTKLNKALSQIEELNSKLNDGKHSLDLGRDKLSKELSSLRDIEKNLRVSLKSSLLDTHDNLSNRAIRPTVLNLNKNRCSVCQVIFPEQFLQDMLNHIPHQCPNCQRIMISVGESEVV